MRRAQFIIKGVILAIRDPRDSEVAGVEVDMHGVRLRPCEGEIAASIEAALGKI
jgi:hypothetical protein